MPLNDPYAISAPRNPLLRVLANGQPLTAAIRAEVTQTNHFQAATYSADIALTADPAHDQGWWGSTAPITIDVQASLDGANWTSLILGDIDRLDIDVDNTCVHVEGRDLAGRLIDAKTQETFANQTSSQVATILAQRHGLTPDVAGTSTIVGRYYSADHDHIARNQFTRTTTEWNLLVQLAQHEGFDVWVTGTTLHFQPATPANADPYLIIRQTDANGVPFSNAINLTLERSLTLAKDVTVVVHSWRSREGRGFSKYSPSSASVARANSDKTQVYTFTFPNLTEQAAQAKANALRAEITRHERLVSFDLPGELSLTPRQMVQLRGFGTGWDQNYFIDRIERRIGFDDGFGTHVSLKNHDPESEAAPV